MKDECKRYKINKGTFIIMIILTFFCILVYFLIDFRINISDNITPKVIAIYETIKDILLVIVSVTGLNLLFSAIIEVKSKNSYLSEIMANDVIASNEFYDYMDNSKKESMYNALEKSLYFKDDISHEIYKNIRYRLKENLGEYYFTECSYSVTCTIHDTYIEKEITKTTKIRSYENEHIILNFRITNFTSKKVSGLEAFELKSVEINNKKLNQEDIDTNKSDKANLDEQNEYDFSIDYLYNKKLALFSDKDTIITMKYITRTSKDDRMSTFRVGHPCKKFMLFYSVKQHEKYRIVVNAYGFLDDADNSTNNSSKSDITITFSDWIYNYDGVTVVILDK